MTKIYRKTATIKAEQFDYEKWVHMRQEAYPMVFGDNAKDGSMMVTHPFIKTFCDMSISDGDWIATDFNGEQWVITDEEFKKTYKELPVIPKEVAEYIEDSKHANATIGTSLYGNTMLFSHARSHYMINDILSWLGPSDNQDLFARAWLDGYVVEEVK